MFSWTKKKKNKDAANSRSGAQPGQRAPNPTHQPPPQPGAANFNQAIGQPGPGHMAPPPNQFHPNQPPHPGRPTPNQPQQQVRPELVQALQGQQPQQQQKPDNPQQQIQRPQPKPTRELYQPNYSSVSGVSVSFDDVSVTCTKPDGVKEVLNWSDLAGVFIMTESEGKYATEMHWILAGKEQGGCVFPNTAAGAAEIIRYMQDTLKRFDNKAIIDAMEGQETKKHLIWKSAS